MLALQKLTANPIKQIQFLCKRYVQNSEHLKRRERKMATKQVHKEIMKYINPYANIKIHTDVYVKVHAANVHHYPNADVLVAELHGCTHSKNCNVELIVNTSDDDKEVDIKVFKINGAIQEYHCEVAVPVKASVNIEGKNGACVENLLGDSVTVLAEGSIKTRDLRSEKISLKSGSGHINCAGILLGKSTTLETRCKGCILVDKLQGDKLCCITEAGDIHTNSCYVESSSFETNSGCLELKNVHKQTKVRIHKPEGALHMSGVHGNIEVNTNGNTMKLQLSELQGDNSIMADNVETAIINISNGVEQATELNIEAESIILDQTLTHLSPSLDDDKKHFVHNNSAEKSENVNENSPKSKLTVRNIRGSIVLKKQSWPEMMYGNLQAKKNTPLN